MTVSFLQSTEWEEILKKEGKQAERLPGGDLVVYHNLFFGWKYAFCPGGPVVNEESGMRNQGYELLINYLQKKKVLFFRIEPPSIIHDSKFLIQKTLDVTPCATTILDLTKTEDQLLTGMHEKTRYNIHLAQKKNLVVSQDKNFESFWTLMKQTGERDGFRLHEKRHYEEIIKSNLSLQVTISNKQLTINKPVATTVFVGFGDTFTYLFGALDYEQRNLMAPYLLQWEGIKLAKSLGYKKYDFFGITPSDVKDPAKHQYAGVTRFKLGFGGEVAEKPGTFDLIISPVKYRIYNMLRKIKRLF